MDAVRRTLHTSATRTRLPVSRCAALASSSAIRQEIYAFYLIQFLCLFDTLSEWHLHCLRPTDAQWRDCRSPVNCNKFAVILLFRLFIVEHFVRIFLSRIRWHSLVSGRWMEDGGRYAVCLLQILHAYLFDLPRIKIYSYFTQHM